MAGDIAYYGDANNNSEYGSYLTMYGYGGDDTLGSDGVAVGFVKIYGGGDNDTLSYYGMGTAKLYGGKGNDWAGGGIYNDVIIGGKGRDTLVGDAGDDNLKGGKGGDWMFGGLGNDWMKGGKGPDHYGFNTTPDSQTNMDMIVDFSVKQDMLHFNHYVYTSGWQGTTGELSKKFFKLGKGAKDGNDYFGYNPKNGIVWYDYNANDPGGQEAVAKMDAHLNLTFHHFMFD
ncbi:MAG: hypothetical protein KDJ88_11290 [Bauldia sp.]|nr:hypothetical protein [Bauldia sp.]